jgi:hypothetical protein
MTHAEVSAPLATGGTPTAASTLAVLESAQPRVVDDHALGLDATIPHAVIAAEAGTAIAKTGADREESTLDFDTVSPVAGNAADVDGLSDEDQGAISDWLVSQSNKTFLDARMHERIGEARTFQAVAMLALDMALFPRRNWDAVLKERNIDPANVTSKHKAAKAVAAAFGLDQKAADQEARERASNDIDRLSLPVEWLTGKILAMKVEDRKKITFDQAGIQTLVQIIKDSGGLNAVAKKQRESNNTPAAERELKIDIHLEEGRKLLVSAGKVALRSKAGAKDDDELQVCVYVEIGGKQVPAPLDPKVIEDLKDKVFAAAAPVDSVVDTLGELFQIGKLVEERETDIPANHLDDPDASSTKMRLTTRLFVLRPDKSVLISPILAEDRGSPVIIARPTDFAVITPADAQWVLETKGRRKAEANIADPMRRKFFASSVGSAEGTQGVARLVVTTEAAEDKGRRAEDVGVLVQPLRSVSGNLPLDVSAAAFKAEFEFDLTATMLRAVAKDLPSKTRAAAKASAKAKGGKAKPATEVKLSVKGQTGKIELGAKAVSFDALTPSKDGTVRLRGDHLLAIVHTLVELPLTGVIGVAVDPTGGLRMTFSTKLADYEVYAPALMKDSDQPSNRYFKAIEAE